MRLNLQKRLASEVAGVSAKKVVFDPASLADIKEAITKHDIRSLIAEGVIKVMPARGVSRVRANKIRRQRKKGLRRGEGRRKGAFTSRNPAKRAWINRVRSQRKFLKRILEKKIVTHDVYKDLYSRAGGGFFRSVKHIQIFMDEKNLVLSKQQGQAKAQAHAQAIDKRPAAKQDKSLKHSSSAKGKDNKG